MALCLGRVTTLAYDGDGRLVSQTAPVPATGVASPVTYFAFDAAGNLTSMTDPLGYVTAYGYNSRNWQTTITLAPPTTGGTSPVFTIGYNAAGWKTSETDALGNVTTSAYDADGRLSSVTAPDPDGAGALAAPVTGYSYDNLGRITVVTDPNSHTTSYGYNSLNQQTSITDALGKVTTETFDAMGHVLTITAPIPATGVSAPVTTYTYSDVGQLLTTTDPLGNVTTNAFDHDGRLITVTAPVPATGVSAPVTSYTWDSLSRLSTETDPLGNVTTNGYDNAGELTSVTQPVPATGVAAPITAYAYDGLGREITVTDPLSGVTTYAFDANGNLISVKDSVNNTTTYAFDHLNRETSTTDANSQTASTTYNAAGQITSQTDKDGRVTNFGYDHDGRMIQEQWMSGGTAIYTATYAYDAAGNVTSASDNNSAYAYTYNSDNVLTQVDNSGTATGPHVVLNVGYDNMQRETSLSATVAGTLDFLNNFAYNADSQVTQITQQGQTGGNTVASKLVNFAFDHDGRVTSISRYANLAATQLVDTGTYGYNADAALTSLSEDKGGTNFSSYTWSYDHMGRLTADTEGSASDGYTYNADSELTAATHSGGGNESYSFDSNGNRTNTGYSTGTNNQLSSDGTYNYLYDNAGNLTRKTTISSSAYVTYTWDYHNRLIDVQGYNSSNVLQSHIHYTYDVVNRLIEKQVDPTGGGTYTTAQSFVYDDAGNIVLVYNGSGTLTDRLLNGPGANNALADENGSGTVSWFLKDREGTTNDVIQYNSGTNTTTVVDHLVYSSFGSITSQTNSANQPLFTYIGQMWDAAVGLHYYHARWYDASTGRFISQDPTGFVAGDANLYRYVGNSPTNRVDPTGNASMDPAAVARGQISQQAEQLAQATRKAEEEGKVKTTLKRPDAQFPLDPQIGIGMEVEMENMRQESIIMSLEISRAEDSAKREQTAYLKLEKRFGNNASGGQKYLLEVAKVRAEKARILLRDMEIMREFQYQRMEQYGIWFVEQMKYEMTKRFTA